MNCFRYAWVPTLLLAAGVYAQPTNVWVKRGNFTSSSGDRILATQKVGSDSLIVATVRWGTTDLEPTGGFITLARHDAAGAIVWTRDYFLPGGSGAATAYLTSNAAGDCVLATKPVLTTNLESPDTVVHKFRGSDGAPMWTSRLNASVIGSIVGALFDPSGNVLIGGDAMNAGAECLRVVKINGTNASTLWTGSGASLGYGAYNPKSMAVDLQGNVAIVGTALTGTCTYDPKAVSMRFNGANGAKTWDRLFELSGVNVGAVDCVFDSTNALVVACEPNDSNNKVNPTVIKYAGATGNPAWTRTITPVNNDIWTVADVEVGPGNVVFMSGVLTHSTEGMSTYVGKWAANGGQQYISRFPLGDNKNLSTKTGGLRVDGSGNPILALIETTGFQQALPKPYFAKMNGATGTQIWYRRSGVNGFLSSVFRSFQLFADGAFNAGVSYKGKSALMRYAKTIPAQPSWIYQPTPATVSREDTATHFVQNPAGDIFVGGRSNERWMISKYNSAGTRAFAVSFSGNAASYLHNVRQVSLATDGNILAAGSTGGSDQIVKFNATTGAQMWKTSAIGLYSGTDKSVFAVNADGIYAISYSKLYKINDAGVHQWTGTFTGPASHNVRSFSISIATDGNPIMAGDIQPQITPCGNEPNYRIFAVKFDKTTGAVLWSYISTPSVVGTHTMNGMKIAPDGSIFIASVVPGTAPVTSRSCLTKLNSAGVQQYESFYAPAGHGTSSDLSLAMDGNNPILVQSTVPASNVGRNVVVVRYNGSTGAQTYATKDTANDTSTIRPTTLFANATGVYASGWRISPSQNREAVSFKLNAAGVRQWTYSYAGTASGANNVSFMAPSSTGTDLIWVGSSTGTNSGFDQVIGRVTNP